MVVITGTNPGDPVPPWMMGVPPPRAIVVLSDSCPEANRGKNRATNAIPAVKSVRPISHFPSFDCARMLPPLAQLDSPWALRSVGQRWFKLFAWAQHLAGWRPKNP